MYITDTIFPTAVVSCNINRQFTKDELSICEFHKTTAMKNTGNFTSKDRYVLKNSLTELKVIIDNAIDYYKTEIMHLDNTTEFYITQSWFNYTDPEQTHHKHYHTNSIVSGVLYFNAIESDSIYFYKEERPQISIPATKWNRYNSNSWFIPVKTGDIILFPSSLMHDVPSTENTTTRTSLAFNVFARGTFGSYDRSTELIL
jgi:uncharacterized protein (TIGR02466 family)